MATIIFKKKRATDKEGFLKLRIPVKGQRAVEKSLSIKIAEKHWDAKKMEVKASHPDRESINIEINRVKLEAKDEIKSLKERQKDFSRSKVKQILSGNPTKGSFIMHIENYIAELVQREKSSPGYIRSLGVIKSRVLRFSKSADVKLSDIDYNWLSAFETWCCENLNPKTTAPTTVYKVRMLLGDAAARGIYDATLTAKYRPEGYKNPQRDYLTLEEVENLATILESGKFSNQSNVEIILAYFLVECTAGLRNSDWGSFKVEKIKDREAIKVTTQKTKSHVYLYFDQSPILERVMRYIREKNLSYTFTLQFANKTLKFIFQVAGIDKPATTHIGRHTCAILLLEMGYSYEFIAEYLGIGIQVVKIYAKITRRKLQNEYDKLGGI